MDREPGGTAASLLRHAASDWRHATQQLRWRRRRRPRRGRRCAPPAEAAHRARTHSGGGRGAPPPCGTRRRPISSTAGSLPRARQKSRGRMGSTPDTMKVRRCGTAASCRAAAQARANERQGGGETDRGRARGAPCARRRGRGARA
eukprot:95121-Chlamydomonas_euryale.AAC.1